MTKWNEPLNFKHLILNWYFVAGTSKEKHRNKIM